MHEGGNHLLSKQRLGGIDFLKVTMTKENFWCDLSDLELSGSLHFQLASKKPSE